MDEKFISYIAFERSLAREERTIKRLFVLNIVLLLCWLFTIGLFMWYITLPVEEISQEQSIEAEDSENIYQQMGDTYGESYTKEDIQKKSDTLTQ